MATPVIDTFDTYTDGDLNGQGSWTAGTSYDVQGTTVYAGAKAVVANAVAGGENATKSGTGVETGNMEVYMRPQTMPAGESWQLTIREGGTGKQAVRFNTGNIDWIVSGSWTNITTYTLGAWHKVEIEWRTSDDFFRVSINDGTFTSWSAGEGGAWTSIDTFVLVSQNNVAGYADEFGPAAAEAVGQFMSLNTKFW